MSPGHSDVEAGGPGLTARVADLPRGLGSGPRLADRDRRVDARLRDATLSSFTVRGTELQRNAGTTGIAWVVRNSEGFEARFGYDVGYDADRVAHAIGVAVNAAW